MKAAFFSLAAMAASAFAAPTETVKETQVERRLVGDLLKPVEGILLTPAGGILGGGDAESAVPSDLPVGDIPSIGGPEDLIELLTDLLDEVTGLTGKMNTTRDSFESGSMDEEAATADIVSELTALTEKVSPLVIAITDAAGLDVSKAQLDIVLDLVVALVTEVLLTVNVLVTILGISPQLSSIVGSVLNIVAGLLVAVIGLLAGLLPGLVAALSPLLAGLGNGLLAPLLTPIAALLAGLSLGGGLPLPLA